MARYEWWRVHAASRESIENSGRECQRVWWLRSEMEPRVSELVASHEARADNRLHDVTFRFRVGHIWAEPLERRDVVV